MATPESPPVGRDAIGTWLVVAQFVLIAMLGTLAGPVFVEMQVPFGAWATAAAAAGLGLWALAANRPGNFNIRPSPREGGHLVESGPYRWVRHPMYTAVIGAGLACAWAAPSVASDVCAVGLALVLAVKARFEERWMLAAHPGYADYRRRTRRFLPWLV